MNHESWRSVTPQFDNFSSTIKQYQSIPKNSVLGCQPRLGKTLKRFSQLSGVAKILTIKAPDNTVYHRLFVEALQQVSSNTVSVVSSCSLDMRDILGSYSVDKQGNVSSSRQGLIAEAEGGFLIVSANLITQNPLAWFKLKAAVLGEEVETYNATPTRLTTQTVKQSHNVKLVILGDRATLDDMQLLDRDINNGINLYTEYEPEIELTEESITSYLGFVRWLSDHYSLPPLTPDSLIQVMKEGARYTEDQRYMPLDVVWYRSLLEEAALESSQSDAISTKALSTDDIENAIEERYYRESYLPERALSDIFDGQVIIETKGETVGQVNGLTVIEVPGHPRPYGEPARISCVIHFGDGDISDVERKAELGGNLHAKGMMIMQAFVSSALKLDEPLPYSASVVFEQSYCEVDGDSASLAELCSFVSALSEYPINQQIAVTGAVDQFGRVQAVGGLNEKIEGFYHVCRHQGLTGKQGVILPQSNLKHLALHKDVIESIKKEEFHIWSVSNVDEAVPILMGHPFRGEDEASVISHIAKRINNYERHEVPEGMLTRIIKNWLN